jgi:CRP-like cAMP-binding protein
MEECLFSPGEIIFKQNDCQDLSLYILVKGTVEIIHEGTNNLNETIIKKLKKKNSYFGEIGFITGIRRTATAKATNFCRLYKIKRE